MIPICIAVILLKVFGLVFVATWKSVQRMLLKNRSKDGCFLFDLFVALTTAQEAAAPGS